MKLVVMDGEGCKDGKGLWMERTESWQRLCGDGRSSGRDGAATQRWSDYSCQSSVYVEGRVTIERIVIYSFRRGGRTLGVGEPWPAGWGHYSG